MDIIISVIIFILTILKWVILARVIITWLPMLGIHISPLNPIIQALHRVTDPILDPIRPYSRFGGMDLSPIIAFFVISIIQNILRDGYRGIANLISTVIVLVIAFTIHEFMHAYVAYQLGDSTAKNQGRLTLDPRSHLDVLGSLMLLAFGFGWAKPVPVNPNYLRNGPKAGMAVVAAAGPISNLVLAGLGALAFKAVMATAGGIPPTPILPFLPTSWQIMTTFVFINVLLFFFNLLPIAPLDGFKIVAGLLPYPTSASFRKLEPAGPLILVLLLIFGSGLLSVLISAPTQAVSRLLLG